MTHASRVQIFAIGYRLAAQIVSEKSPGFRDFWPATTQPDCSDRTQRRASEATAWKAQRRHRQI